MGHGGAGGASQHTHDKSSLSQSPEEDAGSRMASPQRFPLVAPLSHRGAATCQSGPGDRAEPSCVFPLDGVRGVAEFKPAFAGAFHPAAGFDSSFLSLLPHFFSLINRVCLLIVGENITYIYRLRVKECFHHEMHNDF